ncbi:MAG: RNA polymerase sigma factor [Actinocrinis sp.]
MPNSTLPDSAVPDSVMSDSVMSDSPQPDAGRAASAQSSPRHVRLAALLLSAQAGQRDALNEIVVELSPLLWQVARAQGIEREAAEDVIQCTWLSLLSHLDQIHSPSALTAWLVTATKRETWRVRASRRAEQPVDGTLMTEMADSRPQPEESVLLAERHHDVWQAVKLLPKRCQELLRVVAFTHRPDYDAVAVALGMPRGSIGPTRGRCLAKLRTLLDTDTHGGLA